jgi:sarcosine oxidase subunit alpha
MPAIDFEGRPLPILPGDSVASALYRGGVRILSRSFKYHRPRGLYCVSGDCAHCMVTVDGKPAVRSCVTPAEDGQRVARASAWPSPDHDVLGAIWWMRALLPVGFYYKLFAKPRWMWPLAERYIRRVAGIGPVDQTSRPTRLERLNHHPDVVIAGGGVAGLSAALRAASRGESVLLADEGAIGEQVAPGPTRSAIDRLLAAARADRRVTLLERTRVVGVYDGPLVIAAADDVVHWIHPRRIVIATGAVEQHAVFPGNDLPGVWLGRGAARMAGVHGLTPGAIAVVVAGTTEALAHIETLRRAGTVIRHVVAPAAIAAQLRASGSASGSPSGAASPSPIVDGVVVEARGGRRLSAVVIQSRAGRTVVPCDALVVSLGFVPRDSLLRQASVAIMNGAGDVVEPGCSVDRAVASGEAAADRLQSAPVSAVPGVGAPPTGGIVCTCEDVTAKELAAAWDEGYRWTELLKRYTTATMGPCQGLLCHQHLRAFVVSQSPTGPAGAPTTARPPARGLTMEEAAAGVDHAIEQRTVLHDRHVDRGARMDWAGPWKRPAIYGDPLAEYWAVRRGVSIMDVGTLGKYRVCGPDATEFLDRLYPIEVRTIRPGRSRYGLLLNEAGHIFDDGLVAALDANDYFVSATSSGADAAEAWMRDWVESWRLRVHVVNQTTALGAINLAGPSSRVLLARLTTDAIDGETLPYGGLRRITVAGVPCIAIRVGFTGELSFELHHPRSRGVELWDALLHAGTDLGIRPHGLDTLKLLRLEKGHILVGQDTDFDTTPAKIGLQSLVRMRKPYFVGRSALERLATRPAQRRLVPMTFAGADAPDEGAQLMDGDRHVGYLTSSRYSPALECGVALGWVATNGGAEPTRVVAVSRGQRRDPGEIVSGPFYDPRSEKLRA